MTPLELWGGVECTVNRVHDRWFDQLARPEQGLGLGELDRFASLGIRALRFPVLWEHVAPRGIAPDACDWSWTGPRLQRLRELGIRPIAGLLHHGSGPHYTSLVDPEFPFKLAAYARAVAEQYPWLDAYTPVNEPLTTARFSGLYGHWYPHGTSDRVFIRAFLNQVRGTVLAMREIRRVNPSAQLIQTEDCGRTSGTAGVSEQVEFERHRQWLTCDLLTGRVNSAHPLWNYLRRAGATEEELAFFLDACPPDVVGLNYYLTSDRWLDERLDRHPPATHGGNGCIRYADVECARACPDGIAGHEAHLLAAWQRFRIPVAMTEVHLNCTRDEQVRWLVESWRAAHAARSRGADVRAITAWALLGSSDWDSLVTLERGHYEPGVFDGRAPQPRPTALAATMRQIAAGDEPQHPVLARGGWWRRDLTPTRHMPPILIVGARGTLGRAFEQVCVQRGLSVHVVSRAEADISDRRRFETVLRNISPWAIVNAAGYVRVDEAENDRAACYRDNVTGAVNVAAACRRWRLPLVTFSSDLVFDGTAGRPYREEDEPAPLNVYGASKAAAEARVLDLHPDALVVRTSAFFGPWDDFNFATIVRRELSAGRAFHAAADVTVSPTYVPELVDATLDLLIDGEKGIWHLANVGAVTWAEFAREVARAASLDEALVVDAAMADVCGAAKRPRYTPLVSGRGRIMRPLTQAVANYTAAMDARRPGDDEPALEECASR